MKHLLTLSLVLITFTVTFAQQDVFTQGAVQLTFDQMHVDMGRVIRGDIKKTSYTFTNTGNEAIEIAIVDGCSCTTLEWTRGSIGVGEQGTVDVRFDSTDKEKSETVDIDITLKNKDSKTGNPIFILLDYSFELLPGE